MTTTDRLRAGRRRLPGGVPASVVGLALLAACASTSGVADDPVGDPAPEPSDPAVVAPRPDAEVTSRVVATADGVRATYTLVNRGDTALLVPDRLPVPAGAGVRYPARQAYVVGVGARSAGRVQVAQRVFAWPDGSVGFAQAPVVGVTEVAPGDRLTGSVDVGWTRRQPFGDDLGRGRITLPDPVRSVVFCLGVLPTQLPPAAGRGREDGLRLVAHGDAAADRQYLFCGDPVPGP